MVSDYVLNYQRVLGDPGYPSGDRWYFKCPFPACYGYPFRKFNVDPATGAWYCFHCRHQLEWRQKPGGTAQDFVEILEDDPDLWPTGLQELTHADLPPLPLEEAWAVWTALLGWCQLTPEHAAHLEARGIEWRGPGLVSMQESAWVKAVQAFEEQGVIQAGLGWRGEDGQLRRRRCVQTGRILIPFLEEDQVTHFVGYQKCPPQRDGEQDYAYDKRRRAWPKIAGPRGFPAQVYGTIPKEAPLVIVTEGQFKAMALIQRGLVTVGTQGAGQGHVELTKALRTQKVQRALILFDTERNPRTQAIIDLDTQRLARELSKIKKLQVFIGQLPLEEGHEKADIDDYLLRHDEPSFLKVLAAARYCQLEPPKPRKSEVHDEPDGSPEAALPGGDE